jgi:integrase/recombinase XerD
MLAAHAFDLKVFSLWSARRRPWRRPPMCAGSSRRSVLPGGLECGAAGRRRGAAVRADDQAAVGRRCRGCSPILGTRGLVEVNPVPRGLATRRPGRAGVSLIRAPRTLPRVLEPAEVAELLAVLRTARDRAMIQLRLLGGLRRCEVLRLGLGDIRPGGAPGVHRRGQGRTATAGAGRPGLLRVLGRLPRHRAAGGGGHRPGVRGP